MITKSLLQKLGPVTTRIITRQSNLVVNSMFKSTIPTTTVAEDMRHAYMLAKQPSLATRPLSRDQMKALEDALREDAEQTQKGYQY